MSYRQGDIVRVTRSTEFERNGVICTVLRLLNGAGGDTYLQLMVYKYHNRLYLPGKIFYISSRRVDLYVNSNKEAKGLLRR